MAKIHTATAHILRTLNKFPEDEARRILRAVNTLYEAEKETA